MTDAFDEPVPVPLRDRVRDMGLRAVVPDLSVALLAGVVLRLSLRGTPGSAAEWWASRWCWPGSPMAGPGPHVGDRARQWQS